MQLHRILMFIVCCSLCVNHVQAGVTCTAGQFIAGGAGFVQCDFGKDVTKDKHNFNVVRYAFDDTNYTNRTFVLACSWTEDKMDCPVKEPGFSFDYKVDNKLTLFVYNMDKSMTGLYRCQLVPKPDNIDMHTCNLTVIETSINSHTTTKPDENPPTDNGQSPSEGSSHQGVVIALSILLVIFIVASILILACCVMRTRKGPGKPNVREALRILLKGNNARDVDNSQSVEITKPTTTAQETVPKTLEWRITDKQLEDFAKHILSLNSQNDTRKMQWQADDNLEEEQLIRAEERKTHLASEAQQRQLPQNTIHELRLKLQEYQTQVQ